jgi:hypothetical protein
LHTRKVALPRLTGFKRANSNRSARVDRYRVAAFDALSGGPDVRATISVLALGGVPSFLIAPTIRLIVTSDEAPTRESSEPLPRDRVRGPLAGPLWILFHVSHASLRGTRCTRLRHIRRFAGSPVCGTNTKAQHLVVPPGLQQHIMLWFRRRNGSLCGTSAVVVPSLAMGHPTAAPADDRPLPFASRPGELRRQYASAPDWCLARTNNLRARDRGPR